MESDDFLKPVSTRKNYNNNIRNKSNRRSVCNALQYRKNKLIYLAIESGQTANYSSC